MNAIGGSWRAWRSNLARDLVDLAFLTATVDTGALTRGVELAEAAYGSTIRHHLALALEAFRTDRAWANRCIASLAIEEPQTLRRGIKRLRKLLL